MRAEFDGKGCRFLIVHLNDLALAPDVLTLQYANHEIVARPSHFFYSYSQAMSIERTEVVGHTSAKQL